MDFTVFGLMITFGALVVAAFAIWWNMYHDYTARAKIETRAHLFQGDDKKTYIAVVVKNYGPDKVVIDSLWTLNISFFKKAFLKGKGVRQNPVTVGKVGLRLPAEIAAKEEGLVLFPFHSKDLSEFNFNQIAFIDSHDREHWVPKRQIKKIKKQLSSGASA